MRGLSLALLLVSFTSFLTSNALPINGLLESRSELLSTFQNRDLSFELVDRAVAKTAPAKPVTKVAPKLHVNGAGAKATTLFSCKRKVGNRNGKKSKRDTGLASRAVDSSSPEFWYAVGDLVAACEAHKIKYVITGGAAVAALGGERCTTDIDLLVKDAFTAIPLLKTALPGRFNADEYCTEVSMDGIEVDMFDLMSWPDREARYQNYLNHPFSVTTPLTQKRMTISVLQPSLLLEDKVKSAEDRKGSAKGPHDLVDVDFLRKYIGSHH